jgi:ACR3 family arsenite efflux pump ArsB
LAIAVSIGVGINSGQAFAGVIGELKFRIISFLAKENKYIK